MREDGTFKFMWGKQQKVAQSNMSSDELQTSLTRGTKFDIVSGEKK